MSLFQALRTCGEGSDQPEVGESTADEEHPQPVVVAVAEASRDAAVQLDEAVDGFAGVELAEELNAPLFEGPPQG